METETERVPMDAHQLAVLCFVLALGTLLDLEKPSLSAEAMHYYQLGRAALSVDSVLESQSIPAIQAVVSCLALASPACARWGFARGPRIVANRT